MSGTTLRVLSSGTVEHPVVKEIDLKSSNETHENETATLAAATTARDSCQISPLKNGFDSNHLMNNNGSGGKNIRTLSQSVDSNNTSHLRSRTYETDTLQ